MAKCPLMLIIPSEGGTECLQKNCEWYEPSDNHDCCIPHIAEAIACFVRVHAT